MKRFLRLTQEAVFGTYNAAGTSIHVRLSSANAFTPMTDPEFWEVLDGSGLGVAALTGSETQALTATLTTEVTYTQAQFLLGWACQRINAGQTTPWVTSELPNDLASCTADFAWSQFDVTTLKRKRYLGAKVGSLGLTCARDNPKLMATLGLIASTPQGNGFDASSDPTSVVFPEPALTVYPSDVAVFQHMRGNVTVAAAVRTNFENWSLTIQNTMNAYFDESRFANALRLGGRRVNATTRMRLKSAVDERATYEAATVQACQLKWGNGVNSITINMGPRNYITPFKEDVPLDREVYYGATYKNYLDPATATDIAISFT